MKIELKEEATISRDIAVASTAKVRVVYLIIGIFQAIQLVLYILSAESILHNQLLIYIKIIIIIYVLISLIYLNKIIKNVGFYYQHAESIMVITAAGVLILAVINTFIAQSITSDISIYLLTLFICTAVLRVRPRYIFGICGGAYMIFAIGMPYYQTNVEYARSHIVNGFTLTVVAGVIAYIFYKNEKFDYNRRKELNEKNHELLYLSQHDGLTKVYNHRTIHEILEEILERGKHRNTSLYIMLLDLDGFKKINDIRGHQVGDEILRQTTNKLKEAMIAGDVIGRYGGDEFIIILSECDQATANMVAKRTMKEVSKIKVAGQPLTFSAGMVKWERESLDRLIEKADAKLYQAKSEGRNKVVF